MRWRESYLVLNGAELKISEFPDLFEAFGHHFGGQGATFHLPMSSRLPWSEAVTSLDATRRGFFYPSIRASSPDTLTIRDDQGGWVWQDFFRTSEIPPWSRHAVDRKFQSREVQESNRRAAAWLNARDAEAGMV